MSNTHVPIKVAGGTNCLSLSHAGESRQCVAQAQMQVQGSATALREPGRSERKFLTSVMQAHNACIMSYRCMHRDRGVGYPDTAFSPLDEPCCFRPASFRPYSTVTWLDRRPLRKSSVVDEEVESWDLRWNYKWLSLSRYHRGIPRLLLQVLRGARHAVAT